MQRVAAERRERRRMERDDRRMGNSAMRLKDGQ
jgi:hypothetical protein